MAAKVVHTLREDKQGLQKHLGCMNGFCQLFDRRYLLGLHRHGVTHNRLTAEPAGRGEKEFKNSSEKTKDTNQKKMMPEQNQASVESSRNSFSSSSSSTTFSSFDCSKRVQSEWQLSSEPTSPNLHSKQPHWSLPVPDIRDVVRESMTREIRVTRNEHARPVMNHIDSPRPFVHQKSIQYDRKDQNLAKIQKISFAVKDVNEISRFSCDERKSQYSLKSTYKAKEPPRLSLDSKKQDKNVKPMNQLRSEPGSNKRPSSGVVARLMGLDSLTESVCEVETSNIKPVCSDRLVSSSPRVHLKVRPALQQREGSDRVSNKPSVYGEMEKMWNVLEFNTSGKDLRALKQVLEAMQMTKTGLNNKEQPLNIEKPNQPSSPTVKGTNSPKRRELVNRAIKPAKMATEPKMISKHHDVNYNARKQVNDRTSMKANSRTVSPKNSVDKPSSDSSRIKKQSNMKIKQPKIKPINQMLNKEQSLGDSNDGDAASFKSKTDTNLVSKRRLEVTRNDQPKENHRNNYAERLIEDKPMVELAKLSVEQPSPVSVLDAFYIEDTPSPIKNKTNVFSNNENVKDDQPEWNRVGIYNLVNNTGSYQNLEFHHAKLQKKDHPCAHTNADHRYVREILLASGFLDNLDSAIRIVQLYPTSSLIKPELFQFLESQNTRSKSNETIRRKMIFDSVNEILFHKLVKWNGKMLGRFLSGEKLVKEVCSEIDVLQTCSRRCIYDEDDDEVKNIVSADVNKKSEDWDKSCYEVPGVVLDIERLVFKDLIDEVVNAELKDQPRRRCRRLFSM
ncbi:hypothetical protein QVD17_09827 [Tagetes erecta]|uniref:DUF4378 domain-containing protein n=1 Tax=Tagetes erecta TaxID=13708 RepID=A0AAD8L258_TARER|nr:hypothetical protein QVD17_09827 [Tagetes erecta]